MTRFLLFYLFAYGGAHIYFFLKLVRGCRSLRITRICLAILLLLLFIAPLAARSLEAAGFAELPEILSGIGYLWMGLLFLFVTAAATLDGINLLLIAAQALLKFRKIAIPAATILAVATAYTLAVGIYGWFEAENIRTEHIVLKSNKVPAVAGRIRIVQISDLHVGQIVGEKRIRTVLACIQAAAPDMLVSTGDLVDGHQRHLDGLEKLFLGTKPQLGKYAILGNHEYYVGLGRSVKFMQDAGFKVLRNECVTIGGTISIIGIDDSRDKLERSRNDQVEKRLLANAAKKEYRLLLKHRPVIAKESLGSFELQLSGHVHKGQIFPFNLLTWLSFPVKSGLTELAAGHFLYVSRGTGVWGPPIRFLAPPEVTVIDLVPESTAGKNI